MFSRVFSAAALAVGVAVGVAGAAVGGHAVVVALAFLVAAAAGLAGTWSP